MARSRLANLVLGARADQRGLREVRRLRRRGWRWQLGNNSSGFCRLLAIGQFLLLAFGLPPTLDLPTFTSPPPQRPPDSCGRWRRSSRSGCRRRRRRSCGQGGHLPAIQRGLKKYGKKDNSCKAQTTSVEGRHASLCKLTSGTSVCTDLVLSQFAPMQHQWTWTLDKHVS